MNQVVAAGRFRAIARCLPLVVLLAGCAPETDSVELCECEETITVDAMEAVERADPQQFAGPDELVMALDQSPRLIPPAVPAGRTILMAKLHVSRAPALDAPRITVRTLSGGTISEQQVMDSLPGGGSTPEFLVVVTRADGKPVFWAGVSNPFLVRAEPSAENPGKMDGEIVELPQAVTAAYIPFESNGVIELYDTSGGFITTPIATHTLGATP